MRSMVEGAPRHAQNPLHRTSCGPPPRPGEELPAFPYLAFGTRSLAGRRSLAVFISEKVRLT